MKLLVQSIVRRTTDVRSFVLVDPHGSDLPSFDAGAHIEVEVQLPDGNTSRRAYSLVNHPKERNCYEIAVLRQPNGRGGSLWMHDSVAVGSLLDVKLPSNGFGLADDARHHTLIAGGIGITPLLCMARVLVSRGASVDLHYFGRSESALSFQDELLALHGLNFHQHISGEQAVVVDALRSVIGSPVSGAHIYVCGPAGMIQSVIDISDEVHWPVNQVHHEIFGGQPVGRGNKAFSVTIASTGRRFEVAASSTLLDVLLANKIDAPHDCKAGVCGSCLVPVVSGDIDHRDSFLSVEDKLEGGMMCICVSRVRTGDLVLDI